jgi:hypothetical protein
MNDCFAVKCVVSQGGLDRANSVERQCLLPEATSNPSSNFCGHEFCKGSRLAQQSIQCSTRITWKQMRMTAANWLGQLEAGATTAHTPVPHEDCLLLRPKTLSLAGDGLQ